MDNHESSTLFGSWSDYDNGSNFKDCTEHIFVLPWISTVIIILLSFSSVRLKLLKWFKWYILGVNENEIEEISLYEVVFHKIQSVQRALLRTKDREVRKGTQLEGPESKTTKKDNSKPVLKNIALSSTIYEPMTSQPKQTISYDTNLEPAFLNEEDYPEDWLTYDPIRGLISRRTLKELQEKDHSDGTNK